MTRTLDVWQPNTQPASTYSRHDGKRQEGQPVGRELDVVVLEGELLGPALYVAPEPQYCEDCRHFHCQDDSCKPEGPCGSYLCCVG